MSPVWLFLACGPTPPNTPDPPPSDKPGHRTLGAATPGDTGIGPASDPLPVLLVTTAAPLDGDDEVAGTFVVVTAHDGTFTDLDDAPRAFESTASFEWRGKSSKIFPKHSYNLELRDELGADRAVALLGMPPDGDWVLYGPYTDKTYVRGALAYGLARRMGRWAPRVRFAELVLNGRYEGLYQLTERPELGPDRVDLPHPDAGSPGDTSGGYLFKLEGQTDGGAGWQSDQGVRYELQDPDANRITSMQLGTLSAWMDTFESGMASGAAATDYADIDTFVDYVIIEELARNVDAYRRSTYLQKAPNGRGGGLAAGPVWDFDIAFGNADFCDGWNTDGLVWQAGAVCEDWTQIPDWWLVLLSDPELQAALRCRWETLRGGLLADDSLVALIDTLATPLAAAEVRDHVRWDTLGQNIWPNWYVGNTWEDELGWLRSYTLARAAWLDSGLPGECAAR